MRERVARSRVLVAEGYLVASVARVMQISRQALYRVPKPRRSQQRLPPQGAVEEAIVGVERRIRPTATGWCGCSCGARLGIAVNRKRVLRVMREQGLIQRRR